MMKLTNDKKPVYSIYGARGRKIDIYPNKCVITNSITMGSLFTGNATDGEKTIFYADVVGIQFKKPGVTLGYIQLETSSSSMNNEQNNFFNENTFTFESGQLSESEAEKIKDYICGQIERIKTMSCFGISPSDEIRKIKSLYEDGIITESEYMQNRDDLLGLLGVLANTEDSVMSERRDMKAKMKAETLEKQQKRERQIQTILEKSDSSSVQNSDAASVNIESLMNTIQNMSSAKEIYEYILEISSNYPQLFNEELLKSLEKNVTVERMYGNGKIGAIRILNQYFGIQ